MPLYLPLFSTIECNRLLYQVQLASLSSTAGFSIKYSRLLYRVQPASLSSTAGFSIKYCCDQLKATVAWASTATFVLYQRQVHLPVGESREQTSLLYFSPESLGLRGWWSFARCACPAATFSPHGHLGFRGWWSLARCACPAASFPPPGFGGKRSPASCACLASFFFSVRKSRISQMAVDCPCRLRGLKGQNFTAQDKRSGTLGWEDVRESAPCKGKSVVVG